MKTKKEIVKDWITRYTDVDISDFGEYILLTNFQKYVQEFAALNNVKVCLLYTSPSPRDRTRSRMPSSA